MKKGEQRKKKPYEEAWEESRNHYLFGSVLRMISCHKANGAPSAPLMTKDSFGYLSVRGGSDGFLFVNEDMKASLGEWKFVFLTVGALLGLNLHKKLDSKTFSKNKESAAFIFAINYVHSILGLTDIPKQWMGYYKLSENMSFNSESGICEQIESNEKMREASVGLNLLVGASQSISFLKDSSSFYFKSNKEFSEVFAETLIEKAKKTIALRGTGNGGEEDEKRNTPGRKAQRWIANHFPLLASLASSFEIVEDAKTCQRLGIELGAVSAEHSRIYLNPMANMSEHGLRFVLAHEILHVALGHASRRQGRDRLIWNLACDFVINNWLLSMGVGVPPKGVYSDDDLKGKSADEIYLAICENSRIRKRLSTMRNSKAGEGKGAGVCDMLDEDSRYFADFEDACKESLLRGVFLHESFGRGDLPADLVEEIKAICQPPIPWQVGLARWIAERFPLEESKKTYSRPSRRQSSTPDVPRPRYVRPNEERATKTFGVVLDTSGSMDKEILGKGLGAIASYCAAQEVSRVRLVFCDAQPYDEGYVPIESLAQKISVKGRGGTELQQAVNYLEHADDFPNEAPILIITDGLFEPDLSVARDHAFLVKHKEWLPIIPRGEVFEFK